MPLDYYVENKSNGKSNIIVFDQENESIKWLAFEIDTEKEKIIFYPKDRFIDGILLDGFSKIPPEIHQNGYFKSGMEYYWKKKLDEKKINKFTISMTKDNHIRKNKTSNHLILNYESFKKLHVNVSHQMSEAKLDKSQLIDDFFSEILPDHYTSKGLTPTRQAKKVINNLDETIIEHLSPSDLTKMMSFYEMLLSRKYKSKSQRSTFISSTKLKIDKIGLTEIVKEFEGLLKKNPSESEWGKFLKKNLFLFDSKYISMVQELNVMLSSARKVDFGLIDSQGFLDIFEIKKSTTQLLAKNKDRGNYYWSTDAIKAITQAEKYLFNAESKKDVLAKDIQRERNVNVSVIRPRAYLVLGTTTQLDNSNKVEDFRILRTSLKNIEIILYDEMLMRIKNQMDKAVVE